MMPHRHHLPFSLSLSLFDGVKFIVHQTVPVDVTMYVPRLPKVCRFVFRAIPRVVFVLLMTNLLSLVELFANGVVKNRVTRLQDIDTSCLYVFFLSPSPGVHTTFRWNRIICQLSHSEVFPHSETRASPRATSESTAENN